MSIDNSTLTGAIIDAARATAGRRWRMIRPLVEMEARKLAQTVEEVGNLLACKAIDPQRAREIVQAQQEAARGILSTVRGFSLNAVARIAQAATRAAAGAVNGLVGFDLMSGRDEIQDEPAGPTAASVRSPQLSKKFKAGKDL